MIRPKVQQMKGKGILPLLTLLLSVATGCNQFNTAPRSQAQETSPQSQQLRVVATFLPMYWFTKAVAGDSAKVEVLVPPGTEVHEYQATPQTVGAIATANVLVKNGLGLEEFLKDTVKNAGNSQLQEIDASTGIQPLDQISPIVNTADTGKNEATGNPHVWLDPILAKQQVENIRNGLIAADPTHNLAYQANAAKYIQQLETLDNQFKRQMQQYPNCTFVTFHDAYPYLAKRYQLKQVAVVEIPEDQLSPLDVQKAVAAVKQYKVKTLFGEPGVDNKLLQSLSQDLNLTLRPLDSLETGSMEPQHYFTAMKANLQTLEAACK